MGSNGRKTVIQPCSTRLSPIEWLDNGHSIPLSFGELPRDRAGQGLEWSRGCRGHDGLLVLPLHGFNLDHHPLRYMLSHFQYAHELALSKRDAILVVPLSYGQCDDFNQDLADSPAHFRAFVDHVLGAIQGAGLATSADPASIALTGHSGAYYPLGAVIQNGVYSDRINELYLLDATYGRAEDFAKYASAPLTVFGALTTRTIPICRRSIRRSWPICTSRASRTTSRRLLT